ncbi:DNA topoisomerase-1 [Natronospira proteinivora]|uniref:DNA topoisomerase 1 n=1 Tax=Natronospira proteinivora TaxID=1807133 RepID=A0ABT1GCS3_9GAMM|nr:DNA topoisomerase I [Natronospira proteinivora]MCP1728078.1 DNA topoisomerase-1 [Natronospira proteinivora]
MSSHLVIVESPAKARTIEKYLGKDFKVLASYGHVRDLVPKEGAVKPDEGFAMRYDVIERNKKHVDAIEKALKKADALYLAPDPDREGEAIAWHLLELLRERNALKGKQVYRVVFHEITKSAIKKAIEDPREISAELVNAQQARRALDYLVGFNLSPLLWKKIQRGLSAGRVQSPALRMIVERERDIEAFEPQEYWSIDAEADKDGQGFQAKLTEYQGEKVKQFSITNGEQAQEVEAKLKAAANGALKVAKVEKKQRKRNPAAPFTTSTLQQEASRKLGFGAQRTMRLAQQLYEGLDLGEGATGLITYMRTDSLALAGEAVSEIRDVIKQRYGSENVPEAPRTYRTKAKNAQEAHEAIRPTSAARTPDSLKQVLDRDQFRLYELIWKRTVACQMVHALFNTVGVDLACGPGNTFRATGSVLVEPGFIAVYQESYDDKKADDDEDKLLPPLEEGETVTLQQLITEQHFTEPPPRFTEASLVKTLEEYGIGRPSTYASIISTLQNREYVEMDRKRFFPTDVGKVVNDFLTKHFTRYVDYDFTAKLEDELDAVSRGEKDWIPLMQDFWGPFHERVEDKEKSVSREEAVQARDLGTDPKSGRPVSVRWGRFGPFVQIGTKDDEEKPKFAGLRPGQKIDNVELDEALALFNLPRELGETPEGEPVQANIGPYGPYVKYGRKFASLGEEDDVYTIKLDRALEIVAEKKKADAERIIHDFKDEGIRVLKGRFGPYVTDGNKNVSVPKDQEPKDLTLPQCREMIANAPEKKGRFGRRKKAGKKAASKKTTKKTAKKKASKKKAGKKKSAKEKAAKKKKTGKKQAVKES